MLRKCIQVYILDSFEEMKYWFPLVSMHTAAFTWNYQQIIQIMTTTIISPQKAY